MQRLSASVTRYSLLALVAALGVACGGSGGATGPSRPAAAASPLAATQPVAGTASGSPSAQVNAIAGIIARTSNPDDGDVIFTDTSETDGFQRVVQMVCGSRPPACHFEALCDRPNLPCDQVGPKLAALGLKPDPRNPGVYFLDRRGDPVAFAALTDEVYRTVFAAPPTYQLSWQSNRQTTPLPVGGN